MNRKTLATRKKAFSLIELSIVLIIIGLLVAGVTGGASLIKNAELRSIMTEARGYQTAVNAFYERFQALPGDYNKALGPQTGTATGNLNGQIEFVNNGAATARMESNIAWQQLKNEGFLDSVSTFTPASADPASATSYTADLIPFTSIPGSKTKNAGWIFDYINSQNTVIVTSSITSDMTLVSGTAANAVPTSIIKPSDALSIDSKTDDGVANTGRVRAHTSTSGCNSSGAYTTATTTAACALSFQVDISSY